MATLAPAGAGNVDRIPPNNLEAEMAVIGSVMVDREMMAIVSEVVQPNDFYAHVHESIYTSLLQLYERGEPLDKVTLAEDLRRRNMLDKVGGIAYLSSLMDTVPTAASAEYYAKIVREKSTLRSLIHAGTVITQAGYENEEDVDGALDRSEQIVYEIGRRQRRGEFVPIYKLLKGTFEQIDRLYHSHGDRTGITSGFRDIDEYTAGFQPGNLIILASRPAMGKTSMALTMAVAAAREAQKPIAFFSLEMTSDELVQRLLSAEARIDSQALRRAKIEDHQWEKISEGMSVLSQIPIYIDDSGSITVSEIRSRCRRLQSGEGLGAVFIDYLQLVRPGTLSRNQTRNDELSEICRLLKATSKDLSVPIIALAQLNRGVESRNDKRPMLSDLRDCLAGDALVADSETGRRVTISEIVENSLRFNVWAVDERLKLVQRPIVDAWVVGMKQVHRVKTQSGRVLRCTAGHRFLTVSGWRELRDLEVGRPIAVPRRYGPVAESESDFTLDNQQGLSHARLGWRDQGKAMSRSTCATLAARLEDDVLEALAFSDVVWDPIVSIEPDGVEKVYDLTVGDVHNFCANDMVTHNSGAIEQEADLVSFLYRDAYYNPESAPEPDLTEFIIAKQRNGPTGMVKLRFLKEHTLFVPYGEASYYSLP
jgi:replicative DNA helicase